MAAALVATVPAAQSTGAGPDSGLAATSVAPVWRSAPTRAGGTRAATVRLPAGGRLRSALVLAPAQPRPAPLVVVLHGRNGTPTGELARTGLAGLDAVLAYPAGIGRSWNAGTGCCGPAAAAEVDDVGFLRALIDAVAAREPVSRVYLVGYSNGGRLALTAACALAGRLAGVATYGAAQPPSCRTGTVPVLVGYGTMDPHAAPGHVPAGGSTGPSTAAAWRAVEGCTGPPTMTKAGAVTEQEWTGCRSGGPVALVRWAGLGHQWPGAGVVPADETGRAVLWRFLSGREAGAEGR